MTPAEILALAGPVIALIVQFLKKVKFVADNPKWIALGLSLVASTLITFLGGSSAASVAAQVVQLIIAALTGTATAVTSFEIAKNR